jgi:hypothetical protein
MTQDAEQKNKIGKLENLICSRRSCWAEPHRCSHGMLVQHTSRASRGEIDQLHALLLCWFHREYSDIIIGQISYTHIVWLDLLTIDV